MIQKINEIESGKLRARVLALGDPDRAEDCFVFVCEKLSDDGFRRLLQFDTGRNVRFRTWLKLVVANLCKDWHRKEYGRRRPFRVISKLSKSDQLLYHYKFELGMTRHATLRAMQDSYPGLTEEQLSESICRLHAALTSRQRWQLSMRRRNAGSVVSIDTVSENPGIPELAQTADAPEALVQFHQAREALKAAMSKLSAQDRLFLRLRYQEGLSLKDVADVAGLGDLHQAKRRINNALSSLARLLDTENSDY